MKALEFSNILLNLIDLLASYKEADITVNGREIKDIVIHMIEERPRIDIVSENPVPLGLLPRHPREIGPEKPDWIASDNEEMPPLDPDSSSFDRMRYVR